MLRVKRLRLVLAVLCLHLAFATLVLSQEGYYLALQGEGSAAVFLDAGQGIAYITDGGLAGKAGLGGATIDGKPVVQYLLDRGVKRLVITCSHPHRDHMAGLIELVTREDRLGQFQEVDFVDNASSRGTAAKSLYDLYLRRWQGAPGAPRASYRAAENDDALGAFSPEGGSVRADNFVYDPRSIGSNAHDRAIISRYSIGREKPLLVVDFDDASTRLIRAWIAQDPAPRADVVVIPHHGSQHNELGPVLSEPERFGVRDVVISVNLENRYAHPSPSVLLDLLEKLGPEHVFVTGSERGDNVTLTPRGVQRIGGAEANRRRLASLVRSRRRLYEGKYRQLLEQARTKPQAEGLTLETGDAPSRELIEHLKSVGALSPAEVRGLESASQSIAQLRRAEEILEPAPDRRREVPTLGSRGPELIPASAPGTSPKPGSEGVRAYRNLLRDIAAEDSEPSEKRSPPPPPGPPEPANRTPVRPTPPVGPGSTFSRMVRMAIPAWGGVILGNEPVQTERRPVDLQLLLVSTGDEGDGASEPVPLIRVRFADGRFADYPDLTSTELWAAYNFVLPSKELEKRQGALPELRGNDAGLVGIVKNRRDGSWDFAVHPAIADTYLARDAMRLDMAISYAKALPTGASGKLGPRGFLDAVAWHDLKFDTYQWYDERARIQAEDGSLRVEAAEGPGECLMRVRLVKADPPPWAASKALAQAEFEHRLRARFLGLPLGSVSKEELQRVMRKELLTMRRELQDAATSDTSLNRHMAALCRSFDALQSVDRLARAVAILNWYRAATGKELPPLPAGLRPVFTKVPSTWRSDQIFARPFGTGGGMAALRDLPPEPRSSGRARP